MGSQVTSVVTAGITLGSPDFYSPLTITTTGHVTHSSAGTAIYGAYGTVVNHGSIIASGGSASKDFGVSIVGAGSIANTGKIVSDGVAVGIYGGAYVANSGTISGTRSGVTTQGGGTVINTGSILSSGAGVGLYGGGYVTNSATISGSLFGVASQGLATVVNTGSILSNGTAVSMYGGGYVTNHRDISGAVGVRIGGAAGTVVNTATIAGSHGYGIALEAGGYVTNSGTGIISASGTNTGVYLGGGAGTVVNSATISGGTGVAFYAGTASQTLIDSGTIIGTGGTAVAFGGGYDLLQFQPGHLLVHGTIDGGGGANTLEFASAASAGTLTGVGAYVVNFANGIVDAGATWTLAGSNTFAASVGLTDDGSLTVAGTLLNGGTLTGNPLDLSGAQLTNLGSGFIYSSTNGVYAAAGGATDTIVNQGTIAGADAAIYLRGQGHVSNAIDASIYGVVEGVILAGAQSTVTNLGGITASAGGGYGVGLANGGVVTNGQGGSGISGALISGQSGVTFSSATPGRYTGTLNND
ncbi:MAG: hypothetical protein ABSC95_31750, partial [Acetobacteraceae bacterium]